MLSVNLSHQKDKALVVDISRFNSDGYRTAVEYLLVKTGFLAFFVSNGTTPKRKHEKIVAALLLIQLLRARQSFSRDAFSSFFYKKFDNLEGPKFLGILYIKIDI